MRAIKVERSGPLSGSVHIPGSKNSSLALLAAACLADEPVKLIGIPDIADIRVISDIGQRIGLRITREPNGSLIVDPTAIHSTALDAGQSSSFRSAYYFIGGLLAKFGKVTVGYPGGDDFVSRPMDQHVKALTMMGATYSYTESSYSVEAKQLTGASIYFDVITCGATINAMLAAVLAKGTTTLLNAARDPEVTDTANLLNRMGARITGAGTDCIRIEGVASLSGCTYTVIPDRLIAGAFLMAAGAAGGSVTVQDVIPEHLSSCLAKLREIGLDIEINDHSITAHSTGILRAVRVRTAMYPGFATDLQQPLTALLTMAQGKSIIGERVYPGRFNHVPQLIRMGADIKVRSGVASIRGGIPLRGTLVHASDVRAGTCLILAGLRAEGITTIAGIQHIERGYEDVIGLFSSLGAKITMLDLDESLPISHTS
ncbi:UDP-N-acetylglucosamine 1-carboxyvinyltransferase [Paenibacillus xylaniclasticus]|uniref:UDP-N-acetylglucosamine 1-carboxyvinyltransferase n=1 Tax=Paenibacillus xylaniclasticus TaxID=588083 RepID=UPI000FD8DBD1|nr:MULTISPECIES: UDP-N-acetylglucosamine 1-carboxyvinyltransferase [Paenibacillus]GFN29898.1 UDP-N-acetylglucosamine 1-carboxyvinyltransferase 2 [Paenibacillus curdlanolyticus]